VQDRVGRIPVEAFRSSGIDEVRNLPHRLVEKILVPSGTVAM
jgi:hypothetical protein